jgi:precorrin-2 dehydrogenase/sirohydrochlorin ferrochelatase
VSDRAATYYPAFLKLADKPCVVIGGGKIAERKVRELLKAEARVSVISPDLTPGLQRLFAAGKIRHTKRRYKKGDTKNAFLAVAATSDEKTNKQIAAHTHGLVNAVDMPALCSFITPSIIRRGPLCIAISSSGISPALSKTLRKEIEHTLPQDFKNYLAHLKQIRAKWMKTVPGTDPKQMRKRRSFFEEIGSARMLELLRRKGLQHVKFDIEKKTVMLHKRTVR